MKLKRFIYFLIVLFFFFVSLQAQSITKKLIDECIGYLNVDDSVSFRSTYPKLYHAYIIENSDFPHNLQFPLNTEDAKAILKTLDILIQGDEDDLLYSVLSNPEYQTFLRFIGSLHRYKSWLDSVNRSSYRQVRNELWRMASEDQGIRILYINKPSSIKESFVQKIRAEMKYIDQRNTVRAVQILDSLGTWPGISRIGPAADQTLWLCIQHADEHLEIASRYLLMLKQAVDEKRTEGMYYAYLIDRVRMHEGREQVYGTQTYNVKEDDGSKFFFVVPIENVDNVDELRKAMGMEPLSEYLMSMGHKWDIEKYKKELPKIWKYYKNETNRRYKQ